jgi:hypothetical protein
MKKGDTIQGAKTISALNYAGTHGHKNFISYAGALGIAFRDRKSSGVYVVEGGIDSMIALADFAGFNCWLASNDKPLWVVQRTQGVHVVEAVA